MNIHTGDPSLSVGESQQAEESQALGPLGGTREHASALGVVACTLDLSGSSNIEAWLSLGGWRQRKVCTSHCGVTVMMFGKSTSRGGHHVCLVNRVEVLAASSTEGPPWIIHLWDHISQERALLWPVPLESFAGWNGQGGEGTEWMSHALLGCDTYPEGPASFFVSSFTKVCCWVC